MTHASVFSGIGGAEVAAAMLGWENLFHCEINEFGRTVLDYWFPNSKSYEDITTTNFNEWRGKVDVLSGGFPCQPFSYAGKRRGAEDDRYLWPHMFRCIDEVQPTWVIAENVAGITTMVEQGEVSKVASEPTLFDTGDMVRGQYRLTETFTLERICNDLESHGYEVQPILIPACAVGAPHRRDRVFIVARRIDSVLENTMRSGQLLRPNEEQRSERNEWDACAGSGKRICGEESRIVIADTCSCGQPSSELKSEREREEIQQQGGEQPFNGTCGQGNTRDAANTDKAKDETVCQPQRIVCDTTDKRQGGTTNRRATDQVCGEIRGERDNAELCLSTATSSRDGDAANTCSEGLERQDESRCSEGGEWLHLRGDGSRRCGQDDEGRNSTADTFGGGEGAPRKGGEPESGGSDTHQQPSEWGATTERDNRLHAVLRHTTDTEGEPSERLRPEQSETRGTLQEQSGGRGGEGGSERLAPHPDSHRRCEGDKHLESKLANGAEPFGNGRERNVADTRNAGLQETRTEQQAAGAWRNGIWDGEWHERLKSIEVAGCGRWADFPSVSPVHRGNDGLPFSLDDLTISFGKWRTESLKAYGNAIVPQVLYEVMWAIEKIERDK